LIKGQKLIKNHYFKEFWKTFEEFKELAQSNGGVINEVNLQEQVER